MPAQLGVVLGHRILPKADLMKVAKSLLLAGALAAPLAWGQASAALAAPLGAPAIQHEAPDSGVVLAGGHGHGGHGGHMHGGGGRPHFGGPWGGHGYFPGRHFGRFGPGIGFSLPYYGYGYGYGPTYFDDDEAYDVEDDGGSDYADDPVARCQARYRSFDLESGTFLGYDGLRHPCPYLE
jgi:hypothetical protein